MRGPYTAYQHVGQRFTPAFDSNTPVAPQSAQHLLLHFSAVGGAPDGGYADARAVKLMLYIIHVPQQGARGSFSRRRQGALHCTVVALCVQLYACSIAFSKLGLRYMSSPATVRTVFTTGDPNYLHAYNCCTLATMSVRSTTFNKTLTIAVSAQTEAIQ